MEALFARAARLVKVDFVAPPSVIGKTTVGGLQSGLVYGFAGQVDGIVARIRGELGRRTRPSSRPAGSPSSIAPHSAHDRARRPVPHARGPAARLGAQPVMPDPGTLAVFALASLALARRAGPAVLYIVAQSIHGGRRAGVVSALGVATRGLVHVARRRGRAVRASSPRRRRRSRSSSSLGAAYLVWLGIRTLLARGRPDRRPRRRATLARTYRQGVVVNVLNPKTALFFLAFLPQFVDPHELDPRAARGARRDLRRASRSSSDLALGARRRDGRRPCCGAAATFLRVQRYVSGTIFVGLGALAARRAARTELLCVRRVRRSAQIATLPGRGRR